MASATVLIVALSYMPGCETLNPLRRPLTASLRTDSTEIGVRFRSGAYFAKIGYVYTNTTAGPVSMAGCGGPPAPQLEKKVEGKWVAAYYAVYPLCRMMPDFRLESGATHRGVVHFLAHTPGQNIYPDLLVDSIDGTYRLRWMFTEGTDAYLESARRVESTSNEFTMVLRH
jgi:hypothetical protein